MLKLNKRSSADFLAGGGEMGALMRAYDWSASPLGKPETWPQSLRTAVRILLNTNHPMFIWWGEELIQFYNDAYRQTMGPERHPSALGQRGRECWAEIWPIIGPQIEQVMRGGGATWHENQLVPVTRHGRLEQVYWTYGYSPIDEDDGIGGVLVVCRDVTEDYLAAVKLRERSRIWNVTQDMLVIVDRNGVWRTVNPAWTRTFGWSEAELLNRTSEWLEHPDDGGLTRMDVGHLIQGNLTVRFEGRFRHKDGSYRWLSWTGVPDQDRIFAVARDVTVEKAAAERLKATEEALRQSQKMEAVGQLTGGIAHDFNNLLTGIVGSLDLLQTRLDQGRTENVARYIDAAMTSANRAAALTHRLLAFARRQPLIPKGVDVNQLIVSLEDLLRRTIGETIDLQIAAAADLWWTLCDPNQLESALLNLAINARDAMPEGGTLTIATSNVRLDSVTADTPALSPGDYICVEVTDTGVGMSAEVAARAFDPFFTTKPIGQGTGLGLSMIYGFARQSNGHATIDSRVGQGTSIRLYLPRHQGGVAAPLGSAARTTEHAFTGETVLVVEDEPTVRGVILEMLQDQGFRTLEAVDGPSGLRVLRTSARIDLLVTDVGLPGISGRQLADQARETRPGLKILFMTGYAESAAVSQGFLQAGMEMITKPFELDNLARKIRSMISG
ncbi:PAS domain S-box-containing protein [Bradyrhizobium lablabi]|uniref:histidine kinase n=1 Tax=Bradyrhizobium lablabi TaxID=722472 RepID=A0A1M6TLY1_9BRAD|nr:PAS domain-containing sensor histidine kinase [Bradyrhizobium lablabi]SHK57971.1 PAS domain S-box-containing protein [Bradyrhizobium lablabi]